jgi:hypothetical protein
MSVWLRAHFVLGAILGAVSALYAREDTPEQRLPFVVAPIATGASQTDTANLQRAINLAAGGRLFLPAGKYVVSGLVSPKEGVVVNCSGRFETTLILAPYTDTYIWAGHGYANNTSYADRATSFRECGFDGNAGNERGGSALLIFRQYQGVVEDNLIENSSGHGYLISGVSVNGTELSGNISATRFRGNFFRRNAGSGIFGRDSASRLADEFIIENEFAGNGGSKNCQIEFTRAAGVELERNRMYGSTRCNVLLQNAGGGMVNNNNFDNTSGGLINVELDFGSRGSWGFETISGNVFFDNRSSAPQTVVHLRLASSGAAPVSIPVVGNSFSFGSITNNRAILTSGFEVKSTGNLCVEGNSHDPNTTLGVSQSCP